MSVSARSSQLQNIVTVLRHIPVSSWCAGRLPPSMVDVLDGDFLLTLAAMLVESFHMQCKFGKVDEENLRAFDSHIPGR